MAFLHEMATAVSSIIITLRNVVGIITESIPSEAKERAPGDLYNESMLSMKWFVIVLNG